VSCREVFTPEYPGIVELELKADELIVAFQNCRATQSLNIDDGNIRIAENKAGVHTARLALVLHIIECVESGIPPVSPVTSDTMRRAIALTEWLLDEAHRVYAMLASGVTSVVADESTILAKIKELGGKATARDLQRKLSRYSQGESKVLTEKLRIMVEAGILKIQEERGGNGRNVISYCVP
jgi:hypothetical protein